jgi:multiple sugar transport system permease protein
MIVTIPAIALILLLASSVAFVVARFSFWFNVPLLIFFMAANLLPQQVIITPLYEMFLRIPLPGWLASPPGTPGVSSGLVYDSFIGLIAVNVAFQTGFCTFVLSNYMKTLPSSLGEAARVDGASVFRQYWGIILPLCRPALAALATLEFTWIYNDFLWAIVLMSSGDKRPITSSLQNLNGVYFTDNNLISAAALLVALPTLLVYAVLQRQFISGLALGAKKG